MSSDLGQLSNVHTQHCVWNGCWAGAVSHLWLQWYTMQEAQVRLTGIYAWLAMYRIVFCTVISEPSSGMSHSDPMRQDWTSVGVGRVGFNVPPNTL